MANPVPLLLDTHIWLRCLGLSGEIGPAAIPIIEQAAATNSIYISVISIWEIALLVRKGRLDLNTSVDRWTTAALARPGTNLLSFTPEIAIESVDLPYPMHKDPSDRILVASARVENLTLVTRDRDILEFAQATRLAILKA